MVFDDAFRQVDVGDAVRVISCCRIVRVRAVRAINDGLSGCQLMVDYHYRLNNLHSP
jgi:hypothetical protein